MRNKTQDKLDQFAQDLTNELIEQLKKGTAPWQKGWQTGSPEQMIPHNPLSGSSYNGANFLKLVMAQSERGFDDPRWMTFNQVKNAGGHIKKGEHGVGLIYWADKWVDEEDKNTGEVEKKKILIPVRFTVFNATQTEGLDLPELNRRFTPTQWNPVERAESILQQSGAVIVHKAGNNAYYSPSNDSITLPLREQFADAPSYYDTALHELGHWTGHESRLARDLSGKFGTPDYAKEELRAEIASMMLSAELGLPHNVENHASYVENWISVLKKDHTEILRAARDAQAIRDFVLELEKNRLYCVDFEKDRIERVTPEGYLERGQRVLDQHPQSQDRFEARLEELLHPTLPEFKPLEEKEARLRAMRETIDPTERNATNTLWMPNHKGLTLTKDTSLVLALAKSSVPLADQASRLIRRLEGEEAAQKAQEEADKLTPYAGPLLCFDQYQRTLNGLREKTDTVEVEQKVADTLKKALPEERTVLARETQQAIFSLRHYYVLDYEKDRIEVLPCHEVLRRGREILETAGEIVKPIDGPTREYEVHMLRTQLDPSVMDESAYGKVNHRGLFITEDPVLASEAARFRSSLLFEQAVDLVEKHTQTLSRQDLLQLARSEEYQDRVFRLRRGCEKHWDVLEPKRHDQFPKNSWAWLDEKSYFINFETHEIGLASHRDILAKERDIIEHAAEGPKFYEQQMYKEALYFDKNTENNPISLQHVASELLDPIRADLNGHPLNHQGFRVFPEMRAREFLWNVVLLNDPKLYEPTEKLLRETNRHADHIFSTLSEDIENFPTNAPIQATRSAWINLAAKRLELQKEADPQMRGLPDGVAKRYFEELSSDRQSELRQQAQDTIQEMNCRTDSQYWVLDLSSGRLDRIDAQNVPSLVSGVLKESDIDVKKPVDKAHKLALETPSSRLHAEIHQLSKYVDPWKADNLTLTKLKHPGLIVSKDPRECLRTAAVLSPEMKRQVDRALMAHAPNVAQWAIPNERATRPEPDDFTVARFSRVRYHWNHRLHPDNAKSKSPER